MRFQRPSSVSATFLAALLLLFFALAGASCGRSSVGVCGQDITCNPTSTQPDGGSAGSAGNPGDAGPDGSTCASGQSSCNGSCTNVANDPANCGACGHACGSGLSCSN
ncbi:MAG TPA: hypothetical protein VGF76_07525, partial [Polyangiaceae bacterium]